MPQDPTLTDKAKLKIAIAALRTLATDVHNELARMKQGGRPDLETIDAWVSFADVNIELITSEESLEPTA